MHGACRRQCRAEGDISWQFMNESGTSEKLDMNKDFSKNRIPLLCEYLPLCETVITLSKGKTSCPLLVVLHHKRPCPAVQGLLDASRLTEQRLSAKS